MEALEECGFTAELGEALAVMVEDEPGALDQALRALCDNQVNLDYIYTCVGAAKGKVVVILGVQAPGKVERLLTKYGIETAEIPG